MQASTQITSEVTHFKISKYFITFLFIAYIKMKHPFLISLKIKRGHIKKKTCDMSLMQS